MESIKDLKTLEHKRLHSVCYNAEVCIYIDTMLYTLTK